MKNKIYILSSGPGFTDLILLKFIYKLYNSDFIFYESLVNLNLLNFCNKYSLKLLIGKRFNQYSILKKTMYMLIYLSFNKYLIISKLKSGDVNFFSRINNEISFYKKNFINYKIIPGITSFLIILCNLQWFLTTRFNISTILFITYFNNNNLLKLNKSFINKIIIYYMINNNFKYIFSLLNKKNFDKFYFCLIESCSYIYEHIYIFNIYDFLFYINKNFLKFSLPKILIIGKLHIYVNIYNLFFNIFYKN